MTPWPLVVIGLALAAGGFALWMKARLQLRIHIGNSG